MYLRDQFPPYLVPLWLPSLPSLNLLPQRQGISLGTFPRINDIPSTGNEGLIPITMLPFIKLDLIFTSWSGTSKTPISTPEKSTFTQVKPFSVRGSTLSNMRD